MTEKMKACLADLKARQKAGEHMRCPRCGADTMKSTNFPGKISSDPTKNAPPKKRFLIARVRVSPRRAHPVGKRDGNPTHPADATGPFAAPARRLCLPEGLPGGRPAYRGPDFAALLRRSACTPLGTLLGKSPSRTVCFHALLCGSPSGPGVLLRFASLKFRRRVCFSTLLGRSASGTVDFHALLCGSPRGPGALLRFAWGKSERHSLLSRFASAKCAPKGGSNLWDPAAGDRGPLSRKFPRNSGPGVIAPKTK